MRLCLLTVCFISVSFASNSTKLGTNLGSSYKAGQTFAESHTHEVQEAARHVDKTKIPGYKSDEPAVSRIDAASLEAEALRDLASPATARNAGGNFVKQTAGKRKNYVIDAQHDPLVVAANKATIDPLKTINEKIVRVNHEVEQKDYFETCDESKGEVLRTCSKKLQVNVTVIPESTMIARICLGHQGNPVSAGRNATFYPLIFCKPGCESRTTVIPRQVIINDTWVDGCQALERAVNEGICSYDSMHNGPGGTRIINGESITRGHFEEHYTYSCFKPTNNKCERLRGLGCIQVDSRCKEEAQPQEAKPQETESRGEQCLVWEQTYRCRPAPITWQSYKSSGSIFCLGGDCHQGAHGSNTEFLDAISHLSIFREAQADIRASIGIFGGQDRRCSRNPAQFRDCCGNGKGWGVSLRMSKCSPDELELGKLRKVKKCVRVGTFCAERMKVVGTCIRTQTTYCCFANKLARLIQEQAHAQLGIGWGTPEKPDCEGLTPEELSKLDFSKMDLSELYSDIQATVQDKTPADVAPIAERLQRNVANMTLKKSQENAVKTRKPM